MGRYLILRMLENKASEPEWQLNHGRDRAAGSSLSLVAQWAWRGAGVKTGRVGHQGARLWNTGS